MGFTKLDDGMIFSSILSEDDAVFKVWVLILSRTDGDGIARISSAFLSSVCRKTDAEVERCLQILEGPDLKSRSSNDDGRRVRRVDGGYEVINYLKYRKRAETEELRAYERERKRRQRHPVPGVSGTETGRSASASAYASVEEGGGAGEPKVALTQNEREEFYRVVQEAFYAKANLPETRGLTSAEGELIHTWIERGWPLRIVERGIKDCGGRSAKSLLYFKPAVEEAVKKWREATE
jgi:hypothetical protein